MEQVLAVSTMEGQLYGNVEISVGKPPGASPSSFVALLKVYRELLVSRIRNTQCLIDNLIKNDYFSTEDAEIVVQFATQADKVFLFISLARVNFLLLSIYPGFYGLIWQFYI